MLGDNRRRRQDKPFPPLFPSFLGLIHTLIRSTLSHPVGCLYQPMSSMCESCGYVHKRDGDEKTDDGMVEVWAMLG